MKRIKALLLSAVISALACSAGILDAETGPAAEKKIDDIISRMTLDEKVRLIAGNEMETYAINRLGIPQLKMCDGPLGVRHGQATAFPAPAALSATWDPDIVYKVSTALSEEVKAKGRNMSLAPCINILRVPMGGRNFESFGEDPYLTSRLTVAYIKGLQDHNVIATVKHYACNNQEWERGTIDVVVDERALREIYLPGFEAAIKEAGSWSIMDAYNKVNGYHCTENNRLNNEILKEEWGFKGFVVSDWNATHSTVNAAKGGLDLEMPKGDFFNKRLIEAVNDGKVKESVIDDKARRILRAMFWLGLFDKERRPDKGSLDTPEHRNVAFEAARDGIVLLKNSGGVLPIDLDKVRSIAVIGPNAAVCRFGGGGSSQMEPFSTVSPLDSLKKKVSGKADLYYALGCKIEGEMGPIDPSCVHTLFNGKRENGFLAEYFDNKDLEGSPVVRRVEKQVDFRWADGSPDDDIPQDCFSARWTARIVPPKTAEYDISLMSDDGSRLYLDGRQIINQWRDHGEETKTAKVRLEAGKEYDLKVEFFESYGMASVKLGWDTREDLLEAAVEAARKSDVAIVFAGMSRRYEAEGFDRKTLDLPEGQDDLIKKVASANKNTIVVLNNGAPVIVEKWLDDVAALVEAWFPGQEGGDSVSEVLLGRCNPSGKLPMTFPVRWEDCSAYDTYPGRNGKAFYSEGIYVGYRYFDKQKKEVRFPFGYGLSYTTFEYSNLSITPVSVARDDVNVEVSFDVKNTGRMEGAEIAQLYVSDPESSADRPPRELKGFRKVFLKPGEARKVVIKLDKRSLAFYSVSRKDWVAESGEFEVIVGSSSRDARLIGKFTLEPGRPI